MLPEQDKLIEELHHKYFRQLTLYAVAVQNNEMLAQDVVQDTFKKAVDEIDKLMSHPNQRGWLFAVLKNKLKDARRAQVRYMHRFFELDSMPAEIGAVSGRPVEEAVLTDGTLAMDKIRQTLSEEEFRLLCRLTLDKVGYLEAAKEFGISVFAVRKRIERIRKKLYEVFPERKKKK